MTLYDSILLFIAKWVGVTVPRVVAAFLGLLISIVSAAGLWERRIRALTGALGLSAGILMVIVALDPAIAHYLANTSYLARVRILMILLSFIVMVIALEAIRRSHLQERYAILWIATGVIILTAAFFPGILSIFKALLGTDYDTAVVGILFTFLLLIAFHFSISFSTFRKNQTQIAQRIVLLEQRIERLAKHLERPKEPVEIDKSVAVFRNSHTLESEKRQNTSVLASRKVRGSQATAYFLIPLSVIAVLYVGLKTPEPMVGDEVTHFFMLKKQAAYLSKPNFYAAVPTEYGETEIRRYPHPFIWHYLGALFYRVSGERFSAVQLYQSIFWAQLLTFCYLLSKSRGGVQDRSALLFLMVIASLPLGIIFSVTFYQDVPMTAQAVTAFYFLQKRRWLVSTLFLCFAVGFKITALLFLPAFFFLFAITELKAKQRFKGAFRISCAVVILFTFLLSMEQILKKHAEAEFYPVQKAREILAAFTKHEEKELLTASRLSKKSRPEYDLNISKEPKAVTPYEVEIIANHPGDLRIAENWFIYGGLVLWLLVLAGAISYVFIRLKILRSAISASSSPWLFFVGLSYTVIAALFLRTAPDARFFLPGLPFLILPFAEQTVRLPRAKMIIAVLAALAVLQAGYVFAKTYHLRRVTPETQEAISFLKENRTTPKTVFMYPEGNYRLFPVPHNWYLGYKLREFWHADNDDRIRMLNEFGIGAVVVKKHLIAEVYPEILNLGVYPTYFVKDLRSDSRFEKVFENDGIIIFRVPAAY